MFILLLTLLVHSFGVEDHATSGEAQPTISQRSGKIAQGADWETTYFIVDSGVSGATVLVVGGMHGNEPAGSRAAEQILHWPIKRGKLIVVPRANVLALQANTRLTPNQPKKAGNLNRDFPQVEEGGKYTVAPIGELAASLWSFVLQNRPDWVIDLHEGFAFNRSHHPARGRKKSVGSSLIYEAGETMDSLARQIVAAADETVTAPGRRFSLIDRGPVDTGLARACIKVLGAKAVILETTFPNQPISLRTRQHRAMVNVLLKHIGLIDDDCRNRLAAPKSSGNLQVGIFDGNGVGPSSIQLGRAIEEAPDLTLFHIGAAEMRPDVLRQFDVLVFPGGSGSKQAGAIGREGRNAIRRYVDGGGGVLGVCAGAYLCSANYEWSLDLIDTKVFTGSVEIPGKGRKQLWYRGKVAEVDLELTVLGKSLFSHQGIPGNFVVRYANGPIISPKGNPALGDYKVLAWFRSENGLWEAQKGTMINTPAIVSGVFGGGRVVSVSPHPELTPALHPIITQTIRWAAATFSPDHAPGE